ncbi:DNA binding protein [Neodiprion lecontei nucleopolyhedrovirus]|uniref:DNA binding protein n=1 Tax=Neodiprion lecontei nucleopolyhedrovirus (strain Canada) TaxID=654906 RepID=Q6JPF7_NPVNC|nr:DNA binding protein [Neodiprion lecontei nucleopolyhedrovirus]AAQ99058.1 DNA binding protein [Neodiprion lecontei nucleopolyhedrovirus]
MELQIIKHEPPIFITQLITRLQDGTVHFKVLDSDYFNFPFDQVKTPSVQNFDLSHWGCIVPTDKKTTYKIGVRQHGGVRPSILWKIVHIKGGSGQYGEYLQIYGRLPENYETVMSQIYSLVAKIKNNIFIDPITYIKMSRSEFYNKYYKVSKTANMFFVNGNEWCPSDGLIVESCTDEDVDPFQTEMTVLMGAELIGLKKKPEVLVHVFGDGGDSSDATEKPVAYDIKPFIFLIIK